MKNFLLAHNKIISIIIVLLFATSFIWLFAGPAPPKKLVFAGGSSGGAYYEYAQIYKKFFAEQGITLEVLETNGSIENLHLLKQKKADLAFVQGGISREFPENNNFRSLASVYYEPLWVFYRSDHKFELISQLRGKRIGIGSDNSGNQVVALQLLAHNGIHEKNSSFYRQNFKKSEKALLAGEIDAALFISSPKAGSVQNLLLSPEIRLMKFRRHLAYARNFLFIKEMQIAEGLFDLEKNIPSEDTILISTVATVVSREDLDPAIVELFLKIAKKIHSAKELLQGQNEFPSPRYLEFYMHEAAENYFESGPSLLYHYLPFRLASFIRRTAIFIIPLLTLLIPLFKAIPFLFNWQMQKKIERWYSTLQELEKEIKNDEAESHEVAKIKINELEQEIENAKMPASYRKDLYHLRGHIKLVKEDLVQMKQIYTICIALLDSRERQTMCEVLDSLEKEGVFTIIKDRYTSDSSVIFQVHCKKEILELLKKIKTACRTFALKPKFHIKRRRIVITEKNVEI